MRLWNRSVRACMVVVTCMVARTSAYFLITEPSTTTTWQNGATNLITWSKGLLDGITTFDVELARLSQDGLIFVAKDVPTSKGSALNLYVQDVPPADDYFLLFINSTHGIMYSTSSRFTILDANAHINGSHPSPASSAPTVTVSGSPNPTMAFATTFPPSTNGVRPVWDDDLWTKQMVVMSVAMASCFFGAAWTVW